MTLGHVFLGIALVSLGFLGIFHKLGDFKKCRPDAVTVGMFFWAMILMSIFVFVVKGPDLVRSTPGTLVALAGACGACASVAVFTFQKGLRFGNIATSWVVINLSTAIPTVLSVVIYQEPVHWITIEGFALILMSVFLLWKDKLLGETQAQAAKKPLVQGEAGMAKAPEVE